MLEWSLKQTTGTLPSHADFNFDGSDISQTRVDDMVAKLPQLHQFLAQLTDSEALDIVKNACKNDGLVFCASCTAVVTRRADAVATWFARLTNRCAASTKVN